MNVVLTAYGTCHAATVEKCSVMSSLAEKYGCTPNQMYLAWTIQKGVVAIPRSADPVHQEENLRAMEIQISEEDM